MYIMWKNKSIIKCILKWNELNGIKVNKKKSGIMILKGNKDK